MLVVAGSLKPLALRTKKILTFHLEKGLDSNNFETWSPLIGRKGAKMNKSASVKFLIWLTGFRGRHSTLQGLPIALKVKLKILNITCKPLHDLIPA